MTPGEFAAIEEKWLQQCGPCDGGLPMSCTHPTEDYRPVISDLLAAVRERDNTIARAEAAVASAALKVLADFDTVMNVKGEVAYIVAEYNRALRSALDPQETP